MRELPITFKLVGAGLAVILVILFFQACFFSSGDSASPSVSRPSSIPTATPPAQMPEPVLLGETLAAAPAAAGASGDTYVVKSGDTLGGIASQLGVPIDQQAAWIAEVLRLNGIADARLLATGVALRLPRSPTPAPTARATGTPTATATRAPATPTAQAAAPTATPQPAAPTPTRQPVAGGGGTYTVVANDNPHLIGQKHCVTTAQLDAWANQLLALNNTTASGLQVGQVLQLPANTPGCGGAVTSPP
jgi:LysM repeat protein